MITSVGKASTSSWTTWLGSTTRPTSLTENRTAGFAVGRSKVGEFACCSVKAPKGTVSPRCQ